LLEQDHRTEDRLLFVDREGFVPVLEFVGDDDLGHISSIV
jgi:hypothetical protein